MPDTPPSVEWFVIANAAHARVLSRRGSEALQLVRMLEHPASRAKSASLGDDRPGREMGASGVGGAAYAPRTDPHGKERHRFAQELAQFIEERARSGAFSSVSIFAANPFLGDLKQLLGHESGKRLGTMREADLTHVGPAELLRRMEETLTA